jgi:DNA-binding NtrC family response regulator
MQHVWQKLGFHFKTTNRSAADAARSASRVSEAVPVIALIVNHEDRQEISRISGIAGSSLSTSAGDGWYVHFAESCEQASAFAERLSAPVILFDRDWPGTDWKAAVTNLAALPHHACVILVSGVADANLWQEVVRRDGYDVLAKPLRAENVLRAVKLALSYWSIRTHQ